jgi:hypothetical protein
MIAYRDSLWARGLARLTCSAWLPKSGEKLEDKSGVLGYGWIACTY